MTITVDQLNAYLDFAKTFAKTVGIQVASDWLEFLDKLADKTVAEVVVDIINNKFKGEVSAVKLPQSLVGQEEKIQGLAECFAATAS